MKVFLSWSGERSKQVANLLSDWLSCVIQASRPWVSTRDLDRGTLWFGEINDQLKDTSVGVICLTQENKNRPWILFEAGALAKGLTTSRVCTLLIDLETKDIEDPLAQFNHTFPNRDSVLGLVRTLNSALGTQGLDTKILEQIFDTYWEQFEEKFKDILKRTESAEPAKPRPKEDVLGEILENTRALSNRIRRMEMDSERVRSRPEYEFSPRQVREEVKTLMELGLPAELVVAELRGKAPRSIILESIERIKAEGGGDSK